MISVLDRKNNTIKQMIISNQVFDRIQEYSSLPEKENNPYKTSDRKNLKLFFKRMIVFIRNLFSKEKKKLTLIIRKNKITGKYDIKKNYN